MSTTLQTDAIITRAKNHLRLGETADAIELLRSLMVLGVEEPRVLETLGVAYSLAGDAEWANTLLRRTIEQSPHRVSAYVNLGANLSRIGDPTAAVECLLQALQFTHDSADVYQNLGIAYQDLRDWGQAQAAFQNAIRLKPDFIAAYYRLAQVLWKSKNTPVAIAYFRKVLELDPQHARARRSLDEILSTKTLRDHAHAEKQPQPVPTPAANAVSPIDLPQQSAIVPPPKQVAWTLKQITDIRRHASDIASQADKLIEWFEGTGAEVLAQLRRQVANGVSERPAFVKARNDAVVQVREVTNLYRRLEESLERLAELERS